MFDINICNTRQNSTTKTLILDVWLLSFMDVYVVTGETHGDSLSSISVDSSPEKQPENGELRLWFGSMFQDVQQDLTGRLSDLNMPANLEALMNLANSDGNGHFGVRQHLKSPWNMLLVAKYSLDRNINLTTELGFKNVIAYSFQPNIVSDPKQHVSGIHFTHIPPRTLVSGRVSYNYRLVAKV